MVEILERDPNKTKQKAELVSLSLFTNALTALTALLFPLLLAIAVKLLVSGVKFSQTSDSPESDPSESASEVLSDPAPSWHPAGSEQTLTR